MQMIFINRNADRFCVVEMQSISAYGPVFHLLAHSFQHL